MPIFSETEPRIKKNLFLTFRRRITFFLLRIPGHPVHTHAFHTIRWKSLRRATRKKQTGQVERMKPSKRQRKLTKYLSHDLVIFISSKILRYTSRRNYEAISSIADSSVRLYSACVSHKPLNKKRNVPSQRDEAVLLLFLNCGIFESSRPNHSSVGVDRFSHNLAKRKFTAKHGKNYF